MTVRHDPGREWSKLNTVCFQDLTSSGSSNSLQAFLALLATGTGLGNLLNQSRGYLDYGMIWTVAAVSVLLSILLYQLVVIAERKLLSRLGMKTSE